MPETRKGFQVDPVTDSYQIGRKEGSNRRRDANNRKEKGAYNTQVLSGFHDNEGKLSDLAHPKPYLKRSGPVISK